MSAFTDTECHLLIISAPVDITSRTIRIVYMEEYTVLFLTPLSVDRDTAIWHCRESTFLSAGIIQIPSLKHITGRGMCGIRLIIVER